MSSKLSVFFLLLILVSVNARMKDICPQCVGKYHSDNDGDEEEPRMIKTMERKMNAMSEAYNERLGESDCDGKLKKCENGTVANKFKCKDVDMYAFIDINTLCGPDDINPRMSDNWGWTSESGREYLMNGCTASTVFVDVTKPTKPTIVGRLPRPNFIMAEQNLAAQNPSITDLWGNPPTRLYDVLISIRRSWWDLKVFKNFAYIVTEDYLNGIQTFDLTQLDSLSSKANESDRNATTGILDLKNELRPTYSDFSTVGSCHNTWINEKSGFMYAVGCGQSMEDWDGVGSSLRNYVCAGGLVIYDVRNGAPEFVGCFSQDGYTHDTECIIYEEKFPDKRFHGHEICFAYNENHLTVVDATNKSNPKQISRLQYPNFAYIHQGVLNDDGTLIYVDDELDEVEITRTFPATDNDPLPVTIFSPPLNYTQGHIIDASDLTKLTQIGVHVSAQRSIDHNQYIHKGYVYQSNYEAGLRILEPYGATLKEVAYFQPSLLDLTDESHTPEFKHFWNVYQFEESETLAASDIGEGLFLLRSDLKGMSTESTESTDSSQSKDFYESNEYSNSEFNKNTGANDMNIYYLAIVVAGSVFLFVSFLYFLKKRNSKRPTHNDFSDEDSVDIAVQL